jgi:hypothetical protein
VASIRRSSRKNGKNASLLFVLAALTFFCALAAHPTYYLPLGGWGNVLQTLATFHCKRLRLLRNRLRLRSSHPHLYSLRLGCMTINCGMDGMHDIVYGGGVALLCTPSPTLVSHTRSRCSPVLRPVGYAN